MLSVLGKKLGQQASKSLFVYTFWKMQNNI